MQDLADRAFDQLHADDQDQNRHGQARQVFHARMAIGMLVVGRAGGQLLQHPVRVLCRSQDQRAGAAKIRQQDPAVLLGDVHPPDNNAAAPVLCRIKSGHRHLQQFILVGDIPLSAHRFQKIHQPSVCGGVPLPQLQRGAFLRCHRRAGQSCIVHRGRADAQHRGRVGLVGRQLGGSGVVRLLCQKETGDLRLRIRQFLQQFQQQPAADAVRQTAAAHCLLILGPIRRPGQKCSCLNPGFIRQLQHSLLDRKSGSRAAAVRQSPAIFRCRGCPHTKRLQTPGTLRRFARCKKRRLRQTGQKSQAGLFPGPAHNQAARRVFRYLHMIGEFSANPLLYGLFTAKRSGTHTQFHQILPIHSGPLLNCSLQ